MRLVMNKIRPDCINCSKDPYGPYWMRGFWFYHLHRIFKCPTCKAKLPLVEDYNTPYRQEHQEKHSSGVVHTYVGWFMERLDKRSKRYRELAK